MTAGILVAQRIRRTCGMARKASPMYVTCSSRSCETSPPEIRMSSTSGREATYSKARRQRSTSTPNCSLVTSSVSKPTA